MKINNHKKKKKQRIKVEKLGLIITERDLKLHELNHQVPESKRAQLGAASKKSFGLWIWRLGLQLRLPHSHFHFPILAIPFHVGPAKKKSRKPDFDHLLN